MSLSSVRHLCGFWSNMFNSANIEVFLRLALPLLLMLLLLLLLVLAFIAPV